MRAVPRHPLEPPRAAPALAGRRRVLRTVPPGRIDAAPAAHHVPRRRSQHGRLRGRAHRPSALLATGCARAGADDARGAVRARADPRPRTGRAGRLLHAPSASATDGPTRSREIGVRVERHRFEWTRRTARPFTTTTGGRVLLGSARPVDGRMPMAEYLDWVRVEAAHRLRSPTSRIGASRRRRSRRSPRSRGCHVPTQALPAELVLGRRDRAPRDHHSALVDDDHPPTGPAAARAV